MYAYAAYCSPAALSPWQCKWCGPYNTSGFVVTRFVNSSDLNLFGYVGYDDAQELIIVAFRGTQESSLKNWILDLEGSKEPISDPNLPGALVEDGFLKGWTALKNQTTAAVAELLLHKPAYSILATGHSLGGSLAVGAAMTLSISVSNPVFLFTYGQPRVGNDVFANYMAKYINSTVRFVNNRDPVPHLPAMFMGYQHTPREEWIRLGKLIDCSATNGEDPDCSDSLDFTLSISDHLNYFGIEEDATPSPPGSPYPGPCYSGV